MANAKYTQPPCDNDHVAEGCEQFVDQSDNRLLAKAYAKLATALVNADNYKTLSEQLTVKVEELSQFVSAKLFLPPQEKEGYVLVPLEFSKEIAARYLGRPLLNMDRVWFSVASRDYKAMIKAAKEQA